MVVLRPGALLECSAANSAWFRGVMDAGIPVLNLARDPVRVAQGAPIEAYYQLELALAALRNYQRMITLP